LPSLEVAWLEAQRYSADPFHGKWSHLAIKQAAKETGNWDISRATSKAEQKRLKDVFASCYNDLAKAMANGHQLIENDAQHNQGRAMADKMIRDGNKQADEQGFTGIKGQAAIDRMKEMLKGKG